MKITALFLPSRPSLATPAPACSRASPPWHILALLATLVLLAHALALGAVPGAFDATPAPTASAVSVMLTRSLPPPPPRPPQEKPATPKATSKPSTAAKPLQTKPLAAQKTVQAPSPPPIAATDTAPPSLADSLTVAKQDDSPEEATPPQHLPKATPINSAALHTPATTPIEPRQHPLPPARLAASAQMSYQITGRFKGLTYHAQSELLWRNNGLNYETVMTISALIGSRSMSSQGLLSAEGLAPTRFADKGSSEVAAHFEPDKGQISFSANTPPVPWVKGVQDRASILIQLGALLAGSPGAFPAGASITLYTVGPRSADNWTFRVESQETLNLPFGELATLKLSRQLRHDNDKKLELWYAPSLGYLPVRNKISEMNGDFVDQQLSALSKP